jgi:alkanesulfonate monooxygenase SsuD/methylene tetrahydromethanopterin reductase-like flavin-dependent oxidoreductase (luciferase family)
MFPPTRSILELPDAAREVERLGLDELWVVEDCFLHGGLTAAGAALAATKHLAVGVGLLPAAVRNPAIVAMELATLASLYPQRVRAAFGHGVEEWMRQISARPPDRLVALEEVLDTVRRLVHGECVSRQGRFVALDGVELAMSPQEPPTLLIGTTGKRGVEIAHRVGDGLLLPEGAGEAAVRALGSEGTTTTVYSWLRIDEDSDRAHEALIPTVHDWRDRGLYPGLVALSGLPPAGAIGGSDIDRVAIAGTPAECARRIIGLAEAGATSVVVVPVGDDADAQLGWFGDDVAALILANTMVS